MVSQELKSNTIPVSSTMYIICIKKNHSAMMLNSFKHTSNKLIQGQFSNQPRYFRYAHPHCTVTMFLATLLERNKSYIGMTLGYFEYCIRCSTVMQLTVAMACHGRRKTEHKIVRLCGRSQPIMVRYYTVYYLLYCILFIYKHTKFLASVV